jgi:hypothetical protein
VRDYYVAVVRSDGNFCVLRNVVGCWLQPVPLQPRNELRQGIGQINEVRVVTSGRTASIYVNDQQVTAFRGFPPKGGGRVGFFAESLAERYTWAFAELNVRKGPESPDDQASADDALLFADDFSVLDPGWSDREHMLSVGENKLVVTPKPNSGYLTLYGGRFFGDADIRVKIAQTTGGADAPAGIVFWATKDSTFFLAKIQTDGQFDVLRSAGGKSSLVVRPEILEEVIKGLSRTNELRVVTQGKTATVYINGKQAAAVETDALPEAGSKIGFFAGAGSGPYSWSFSDLVIRKPE